MYAMLVGKKIVDYVSKKTGSRVQGIELHFIRETFPSEHFTEGSFSVMDTFYIKQSDALYNKVIGIPVMSDCNITTFQTGRYLNLVDCEQSEK